MLGEVKQAESHPEKLAQLRGKFDEAAENLASIRSMTEGVIIAFGGVAAGLVLYVDRGISVFGINDFGMDTFGIGEDSGQPVSPAYRAPFRFSGTIDQVMIEINDSVGR